MAKRKRVKAKPAETSKFSMVDTREVMTAEQLASYLSFSKNWIYRKAEAGELPGIKMGNRWRFKKSIIDQWLEQRIRSA